METNQTKTQTKDFWEDMRDTVLDGMKELRVQGDEFARKSRLRMDIAQTQRRLRHTYELLGENVHKRLGCGEAIPKDDPACQELCSRADYYRDELTRLRAELQRSAVPN